jgi:hypothetical protein
MCSCAPVVQHFEPRNRGLDRAIQVMGPDGSISEFPEGMADADIEAVMARSYPGPAGG